MGNGPLRIFTLLRHWKDDDFMNNILLVCLLTSLPVIEESYWLFCIFTLQLGNLLSSLISCNSFSVMLSEFSRCTIAASINKNTFSSFIPIVIPHKGFLLCYIGYNVGLITNSLKWWNVVAFWRLYKNLKSFFRYRIIMVWSK